MKKLLKISSDCLDIVKRIQSIDSDYFVMFNLDNNKFELHNKGQSRKTYCLTFPFDCLDERAYLYTLKTRVQNSDEIFAEIENYNQKRENAITRQVFDDFKERLYDS